MKTMKTIMVLTTLLLIATSCELIMSPNQTSTNEYSGSVCIYSPQDSIYVRTYGGNISALYKYEYTKAPSNYVTTAGWVSLSLTDTLRKKRDEELHYLHIKKLSNNSLTYVIEGYGIKINDQRYWYKSWENPGDTLFYTDPATGKRDTIVKNVQAPPCPIQQVIDSLLVHYPEHVKVIDDMEGHRIGDYELVKSENEPRIYINFNEELPH